MAPPNPAIKPLGPITSAIRSFREALYRPGRTTIEGIDESLWPNPLQPVQPIGPPGSGPLQWQMDWGRNIIYTPRDDAEYSSAQLRQFGRYIISRICIENNKDILTRMPHRIQLKPLPGERTKDRTERSKGDKTLISLNRFFERPDGEADWSDWLRPILDDMLVIDAASVFMGRQPSGKIAELWWVEGSSIIRLVDRNGRTPKPPSVAYQQSWQGYPRVDLTTDQLCYRPRNIVPRNTQSSYIYGMSPTEQIVKEIEIGIARLQFILDFYTEGTIPGGMLFVPKGTPADKVKEAQAWMDSNYSGDLAKRRRIMILQGFQEEGKNEQMIFPKEPQLADVFDELHIRKICFAYGTSPQRLMRQMNRASAQAAQESAEEEGTLPWLKWLKSMMDYIIQVKMGYQEYEFSFDPFIELDRLKQAMADAEDLKVGLYTRNEKRQDRGDDPIDVPEADELSIVTGQGVVPLDAPIPVRGSQPGSSSTGRVPRGGAQPRATARVNATSSVAGSSSTKTNGSTRWEVCQKHKDTGPSIKCSDCVRAEIEYNQKLIQEQNQ